MLHLKEKCFGKYARCASFILTFLHLDHFAELIDEIPPRLEYECIFIMITFIPPCPRSIEVSLHKEIDSILEVMKGLDRLVFVVIVIACLFLRLSTDFVYALRCI